VLGNSHARFLGGDPAARPVSYVITKKKIIDISSDMYNNKYMYDIKEDLK